MAGPTFAFFKLSVAHLQIELVTSGFCVMEALTRSQLQPHEPFDPGFVWLSSRAVQALAMERATELKLRSGVSLPGGAAEPFNGFTLIFRQTSSLGIHLREIGLRRRIASFRRFTKA